MADPAPEAAIFANSQIELRTGVWHGDTTFRLEVPPEWEVVTLWPETPPPLTDQQIAASLENPMGQRPIRELCNRESRPVVLVDDLNRPTPVRRILPHLLRQFELAGVPSRLVTVVVSTGAHALPDMKAVAMKIGQEAASLCRVIIHDSTRDCVSAGKTSNGTPVLVNRAVASTNFLVGVGGIYPNQTAGFGGGSKLLLGVLGFRSISRLHYRNPSVGWGVPDTGRPGIRRDLDEIARMLRLRTSIAAQVDTLREIIHLGCGDPFLVATDGIEFARRTFTVPGVAGADVVISNAYPSDISLTTTMQKGITPLAKCGPGVSRIVIASCPNGAGHHSLFPIASHPRLARLGFIVHRIANMSPQATLRKMGQRLNRREPPKLNPIWLYRPGYEHADFPVRPAGFELSTSWTELVSAVQAEHPNKQRLHVLVYPCAPLQVLDCGLN